MDGQAPHPARASLLAAAALTAVAAGIHFRYAPMHWDEYRIFGAAFVAMGLVQLVAALVLLRRRPSRRVLYGVIVANVGIAALWAWTRFVALPMGPDAGTKEAVGLWDSLCSAIEVLAAFAIAYAMTKTRPASRPREFGRDYQLA